MKRASRAILERLGRKVKSVPLVSVERRAIPESRAHRARRAILANGVLPVQRARKARRVWTVRTAAMAVMGCQAFKARKVSTEPMAVTV